MFLRRATPPYSRSLWLSRADCIPPLNPGESTDLEIDNRTFYCPGCNDGGGYEHVTQARLMIHRSDSFAGTVREKNPVPVVTCQPITPGIRFAATKESLPKHGAHTELRNGNEHF